MILNLKNYTEDQLAEDKGLQIQLERVRVSEKESRASDYAKDPANIEVRDKEGYFKVSKFRQIWCGVLIINFFIYLLKLWFLEWFHIADDFS